MRPETKLKDIYATELRRAGAHVTRVENLVETGTPDFNICANGVDAWIEFKAPKAPVRSSSKVFGQSSHRLTPEQTVFIEERAKRGGIALVVVRVGIFMCTIHSADVRRINESTVDELCSLSLLLPRQSPAEAARSLIPLLLILKGPKR